LSSTGIAQCGDSGSEALADGRTLIRYDPRGCDLSDRIADDFSLDTWVADLEAVADAAKLRRFR
jgi:pimeloyl-ACP methyl ester carboxylesterase